MIVIKNLILTRRTFKCPFTIIKYIYIYYNDITKKKCFFIVEGILNVRLVIKFRKTQVFENCRYVMFYIDLPIFSVSDNL